MSRPFKIFTARSSRKIALAICEAYGTELGDENVIEFSDGEFEPSFNESIRGADIFLVQSTMPPADNLMELLLMIDAARRASAYKINAVIPYFGFARQDKKGKPRVPIGAKLIANLLTSAGVDRVMTMDLHADQIQGFFDIPVDHLYSSSVFIPYIESLKLPNLTIASPDMGGSNRANSYAKFLNSEIVICYKHREKANEVGKMLLIGDVIGKDVVLVDDMIDTAGTLTTAADLMMEMGANSVRAVCTHGVFSGPAYKRIEESKLIEIAVTDTIPKVHESSKVKEISIANLFASSIDAVLKNESISKHFLR
ncbi:ribose-phosphate pyrophosphokinase [Flavobacteriales bacterium]|jgi:ribose-phosphate pyrophosphokinase|nr:ribose-phosphate pyrophosphokinase [Flavobacteriales bacterium]|tara:strand:+ start:2297 stop:3229 length:933 start_codon:yes stop_codon:yes gene_type:complete